MWEQHRVFFTDSTLAQTLEQEGLNIIMSESQGTSIEPSLCFLSTKESHDYSTENIKSREEYAKISIKDLNHDKVNYKAAWQRLLRKHAGNTFVFGAGHNADRFIQFTEAHDYIESVLDDDCNKQGLFLAAQKRPVEPANIIMGLKKPVILMGCHDRHSKNRNK